LVKNYCGVKKMEEIKLEGKFEIQKFSDENRLIIL